MALLIEPYATAAPGRAAVVDDRGRVTWAELDDRVVRLIDALRRRGLTPGATVAVFAGNQRESIEVMLACMHAGWLVVPVNWHWVAAELAYVLDDADADVLVVADAWVDVAAEAIASTGREILTIAIGEHGAAGFERYEEVVAGGGPGPANDLVFGGPMFYTSGTTGFPKGVRSVLGRTGGPVEMWQLIAGGIGATIGVAGPETDGGTTLLLCGPVYHSAQWVFTFATLLGGGTVVLHHRFDAARLLADIDRYAVTSLHLVPAQMVRLLRLDDATRAAFRGDSLQRVHHGAAPCPESVKRAMIDWWGPIVDEYYGGTEGGFITMISAADWLERPGSVGRALPTVELRVVDEDGAELPPGSVGDLYFRNLLGSDFEYHKAPAKTAAAHREPGVGTLGDVGWLDEDGFLHLSDRRIDMIISGGVNIYPAEIEGLLSGHPAVADVAVFGIPDDEMGERVMAVVEPAAPVSGSAAERALIADLTELCRSQLAGYKCPRSWEVAERLPRNEAGKLAKRLLRDPYWSNTSRSI